MFVLCGNLALCTHIPNIAVFTHQDPRMEEASKEILKEAFTTTRLEWNMSFLHFWESMSQQEKIRQVRHKVCQSRRETEIVRIGAIPGADDP